MIARSSVSYPSQKYVMKLTVSGLGLQRGDINIFRNLNLNLSSDRVWILRGPNGCGKTSLLKLLAGFIAPSKGKINWFDTTDEILPTRAFLSHKEGLSLVLTPIENLRYLIELNEVAFNAAQITLLLEQFELKRVAHLPCWQLSLGQRRKVIIISVILTRKQVWLLDEPFNVLDKSGSNEFCKAIKMHQQNGGMIILSSHQIVDTDFQVIDLPALSTVC